MRLEVTTWYLEMLDPRRLRPRLLEQSDLEIRLAQVPVPEFSRFLYASVGGQWYWCDRLAWSRDRWLAYLSRPQVETWVAYMAGTPAGYIELDEQFNGQVEIACFGLLPQFMGMGLGGHLLTVGVQRAWERGARRVWVHTCSLDGPYAYKNYESRGFSLYDTQVAVEDLPDDSPGPWTGIDPGL
jgi:ribosomal protein S18 acetylase RimI-like enzyme